MQKETLENLEKQIEKQAKTRQKRKKRKMRVSGKSVFGLQRIIKSRFINSWLWCLKYGNLKANRSVFYFCLIMMRFIVRILANSLAIYLAAYFGIISLTGRGDWKTLLLAGFILAFINTFIRPILKLISLPLIILTFGLFCTVINIFTIWLLTAIMPEISISGFWAFFWTVLIISVVNSLFYWLTKKSH